MLRVPLDLSGAMTELPEEAARYVAKVHRLSAGDAFVAFDVDRKTEVDARIVSIARGRVAIEMGLERATMRIPRHDVRLFQGLLKADKMDAIVRDATELGTSMVVAVQLARSVPTSKNAAALARWKRVAAEAARQCGRGDVPVLVPDLNLARCLEHAPMPSFVLDPRAEISLGDAVRTRIARASNERASVGLFVGPEGGFDHEEAALLEERGLSFVRLGAFTMRAETAATAALAVIADALLAKKIA
jgi:16S rRNA (uracil1498-N3)-methyltransferase